MSPEGRIDTPIDAPGARREFVRLVETSGHEQSIVQPGRIAALKLERLAKDPRLVPATRCDALRQ